MQVIDQIFQQLDEEDNGYVSTEQLISILQSLENNSENSSDQKDDMLSTQHLTYSNSPPLGSDYRHLVSIKKMLLGITWTYFQFWMIKTQGKLK